MNNKFEIYVATFEPSILYEFEFESLKKCTRLMSTLKAAASDFD